MKSIKTIYSNGAIYCKNERGEFHNEFGPALIDDFQKVFYVNGFRHRLDGPAEIYDGDDYICRQFKIRGKGHRVDGPARYENIDEETFISYYVCGKYIKIR